MDKRTFFVRAVWDEDAEVFCSKSDIRVLPIEAATLAKFRSVLVDAAPELIVANHISAPDLAGTPLKDLLPTIVWEPPGGPAPILKDAGSKLHL